MTVTFENPWSWHQFPNMGYIQSILTPNQLAPIYKEVAEIQQDFSRATPFNYQLAGNIKKEFKLVKTADHISNIIKPLCYQYFQKFEYIEIHKASSVNFNSDLELQTMWVNFQQKTEFNPIHTHTGVMSFVIWLKIPFTNQNESERFEKIVPSHEMVAGKFTFLYTDALGNIQSHDIPVDQEWEGSVVVFPARMSHQVYPFYTSDDYRITVSGNFKIKSS